MISTCYQLSHLEPSGQNSATESSSSPSNDDSKPLIDKPDKTTEGGDATNKPSSEANNTDQVHISFDGLKMAYSLKVSLSSYFIPF